MSVNANASSYATLRWVVPADHGGSPITGYVVQYREMPDGAWRAFPSSPGHPAGIALGLHASTEYQFRVASANPFGTGTYSNIVSATTLPAVPSVPWEVRSNTTTQSSATLAWRAPASDGGLPITDYAVQYREVPGGQWAAFGDGESPDTSATVTGLSAGTGYVFRVAAANSAGTGPYSDTASVTVGVPTAPQGLAVYDYATTPSSVTLAWFAPASDGGSPVTSYAILYAKTASITQRHHGPAIIEFPIADDGVATAGAINATVPGLDSSSEYLFGVIAVNSVGPGGYSLIYASTSSP